MRQRDRNLPNWLWTIILCLVFVTSLEVVARLDDWWQYRTSVLATPDQTSDLNVIDSLGLRGRPNGHFRHWRLNAFGFRGPDHMNAKPPVGVLRVVTMGSSETMGLTEGPGGEYPQQLRDSLRGQPAEVVNAGIPGQSTPGLISQWNNWIVRFEPHVVFVYAMGKFYLLNDVPGGSATPRTIVQQVPHSLFQRLLQTRIIQRVRDNFSFPQWWIRRLYAREVDQTVHSHPDDWVFRNLPYDRLNKFISDLDSLTRAVRASGALPIIIVPATTLTDSALRAGSFDFVAERVLTPRSPPAITARFIREAADSMRALAARRGVPILDAESRIKPNPKLMADRVHFTREGAAVVAGMASAIVKAILAARRPRGEERGTRGLDVGDSVRNFEISDHRMLGTAKP
jgi:lysophospholipase L1-like esterase